MVVSPTKAYCCSPDNGGGHPCVGGRHLPAVTRLDRLGTIAQSTTRRRRRVRDGCVDAGEHSNRGPNGDAGSRSRSNREPNRQSRWPDHRRGSSSCYRDRTEERHPCLQLARGSGASQPDDETRSKRAPPAESERIRENTVAVVIAFLPSPRSLIFGVADVETRGIGQTRAIAQA